MVGLCIDIFFDFDNFGYIVFDFGIFDFDNKELQWYIFDNYFDIVDYLVFDIVDYFFDMEYCCFDIDFGSMGCSYSYWLFDNIDICMLQFDSNYFDNYFCKVVDKEVELVDMLVVEQWLLNKYIKDFDFLCNFCFLLFLINWCIEFCFQRCIFFLVLVLLVF